MPTAVEDIKDRLDIVEFIGRYVPLKKAGRTYKGLCPFHSEKTPSFVVYPDDGHYHCFGCGQSGDIFTFVMKAENMEFGDALRLLAERAGVPLVTEPQAIAQDRARERLRELNAAAAHYYHNLLLRAPEAQVARDFLARRGVNAETIVGWELGYSLESWEGLTAHLVGRGFAVEDMLAAGLVRQRSQEAQPEPGSRPLGRADVHDYFHGRVMFPIRDARGNVTGFGARTLGSDQPKFLNSPQTQLFDKSATLFGIDHAREPIRSAGQAIIVEGYLDVLIAHQMGITNVVASLGTALTERQLGQLKKLGKSLVLALDADAAGDEATLRGLTTAREVMDRVAVPVPTWRGLVQFEYRLKADLRILSLPRGEDPDNVILRSVDEWRELVQHAEPVVDFYFRQAASRLDLTSPKGKSAAVEQLLPIIKEIDDQVAQSHYISRLSSLVQVDERLLLARLRSLRAGQSTAAASPAAPTQARRPLGQEEYCLAQLLGHAELAELMSDLRDDDFGDPVNRRIFALVMGQHRDRRPIDLQELAERLDPALQERVTALASLSESLPPAADEDLENEALVAAIRVRLANRKQRLERITFALRDPETATDADLAGRFTAESEELRQEIGQLQKALAERTVLGRRRAAGG